MVSTVLSAYMSSHNSMECDGSEARKVTIHGVVHCDAQGLEAGEKLAGNFVHVEIEEQGS